MQSPFNTSVPNVKLLVKGPASGRMKAEKAAREGSTAANSFCYNENSD